MWASAQRTLQVQGNKKTQRNQTHTRNTATHIIYTDRDRDRQRLNTMRGHKHTNKEKAGDVRHRQCLHCANCTHSIQRSAAPIPPPFYTNTHHTTTKRKGKKGGKKEREREKRRTVPPAGEVGGAAQAVRLAERSVRDAGKVVREHVSGRAPVTRAHKRQRRER